SIGMVIMAKKKYDSLSPEAQRAIDAMMTEQEIRQFGAFWDRDNLSERKKTEALPNHTVVDVPDEEVQKILARLSPVFDRWASERPDGRELIEKFGKILREVQSEPRLGK